MMNSTHADLHTDTPSVTIVVLTRQRSESLKRTLEALKNLTYPSYEILVIDNLSTDNTAQVAQAAGVRYIYCSKPGVSMCRQTGIDAANTPIVAMCDDDCVPVPGWLDHMVRRHTEDPDLALLGGHIINIGFGENRIYKGRGILLENSITQFVEDPRDAFYYGSANIAFKRDAIQSVGGYDPFFRTGGYEEADLITRLKVYGYTVAYEPEAVVEHHHVDTSFRHNRIFYTNQLLRLYYHMKHRRPQGLTEWFRFAWYELRILTKEIIPLLKGILRYIVRGRIGEAWGRLIRIYSSIVARAAIPWIFWVVYQRNKREH